VTRLDTNTLLGKLEKRRLGVNRWIVLKTYFTETGYDIMECIHHAQDREK